MPGQGMQKRRSRDVDEARKGSAQNFGYSAEFIDSEGRCPRQSAGQRLLLHTDAVCEGGLSALGSSHLRANVGPHTFSV